MKIKLSNKNDLLVNFLKKSNQEITDQSNFEKNLAEKKIDQSIFEEKKQDLGLKYSAWEVFGFQ